MLGAMILGLVRLIRGTDNWKDSRAVRFLPIIMALAMNLGVPPLLFLQVLYGYFFFSSSILIAIPWISVFFLLMSGYGFVYAARYASKKNWHASAFLGISLVSTILVSFFFSNNVHLMINPSLWQEIYSYSESGFQLNPQLLQVIPRWIWAIAPCLVAGVALMNSSRAWCLGAALLSTVCLTAYSLQMPAGMAEDGLVRFALISDFALQGVLVLLVSFIPNNQSKIFTYSLWGWLVVKSVVTVALRHGIRLFSLNPIYDLSALPQETNWPLIGVFFGALIIGFSSIIWMLKNARKEVSI